MNNVISMGADCSPWAVQWPSTLVSESLDDRIMEKVKALLEKQKPVFVKMTCHNCGAGVYQKAEDHIFKCKFCHTTYLVGTEMIRDGGR